MRKAYNEGVETPRAILPVVLLGSTGHRCWLYIVTYAPFSYNASQSCRVARYRSDLNGIGTSNGLVVFYRPPETTQTFSVQRCIPPRRSFGPSLESSTRSGIVHNRLWNTVHLIAPRNSPRDVLAPGCQPSGVFWHNTPSPSTFSCSR